MERLSPWTYNVFAFCVMAVATAGLILVAKWKREVDESCPVEDKERLDEFERLYYEGEIDEGEFRRIEAAFAGKSSRPRESPSKEPRLGEAKPPVGGPGGGGPA